MEPRTNPLENFKCRSLTFSGSNPADRIRPSKLDRYLRYGRPQSGHKAQSRSQETSTNKQTISEQEQGQKQPIALIRDVYTRGLPYTNSTTKSAYSSHPVNGSHVLGSAGHTDFTQQLLIAAMDETSEKRNSGVVSKTAGELVKSSHEESPDEGEHGLKSVVERRGAGAESAGEADSMGLKMGSEPRLNSPFVEVVKENDASTRLDTLSRLVQEDTETGDMSAPLSQGKSSEDSDAEAANGGDGPSRHGAPNRLREAIESTKDAAPAAVRKSKPSAKVSIRQRDQNKRKPKNIVPNKKFGMFHASRGDGSRVPASNSGSIEREDKEDILTSALISKSKKRPSRRKNVHFDDEQTYLDPKKGVEEEPVRAASRRASTSDLDWKGADEQTKAPTTRHHVRYELDCVLIIVGGSKNDSARVESPFRSDEPVANTRYNLRKRDSRIEVEQAPEIIEPDKPTGEPRYALRRTRSTAFGAQDPIRNPAIKTGTRQRLRQNPAWRAKASRSLDEDPDVNMPAAKGKRKIGMEASHGGLRRGKHVKVGSAEVLTATAACGRSEEVE